MRVCMNESKMTDVEDERGCCRFRCLFEEP